MQEVICIYFHSGLESVMVRVILHNVLLDSDLNKVAETLKFAKFIKFPLAHFAKDFDVVLGIT